MIKGILVIASALLAVGGALDMAKIQGKNRIFTSSTLGWEDTKAGDVPPAHALPVVKDGPLWCRAKTHATWIAGSVVDGKCTMTFVRRLLEVTEYDVLVSVNDSARVLEVRSKKVEVPAEETTYWCTVEKLPDTFSTKHHIVEFGPTIQRGNEDIVHHMEVFHCEHPPDFQVPLYQGPCHSPDRPREIDACKRVLAAWAMGASAFVYPQEAGLPMGGPDFNPFLMLEVHYNNPGLLAGRVDSSGIQLHYTPRPRPYDAGIMELGLEYTAKMAIPPAMPSFTLAGYCIPECTALGLPPEGIHIFGSQLHTHLTGVRAWTKHLRGSEELPELNRDDHYSTHFLEGDVLSVSTGALEEKVKAAVSGVARGMGRSGQDIRSSLVAVANLLHDSGLVKQLEDLNEAINDISKDN
nr:tyramine beta-hydroxylase [Penaeus vannamei]